MRCAGKALVRWNDVRHTCASPRGLWADAARRALLTVVGIGREAVRAGWAFLRRQVRQESEVSRPGDISALFSALRVRAWRASRTHCGAGSDTLNHALGAGEVALPSKDAGAAGLARDALVITAIVVSILWARLCEDGRTAVIVALPASRANDRDARPVRREEAIWWLRGDGN
jgi:hypothetical protein